MVLIREDLGSVKYVKFFLQEFSVNNSARWIFLIYCDIRLEMNFKCTSIILLQ